MSRALTLSLLILLAFAPGSATAETMEITPFFGHRIGGDLEAEDGPAVTVDDDTVYGFALEIPLRETVYLELLWSRQETTLDEDDFGSPEVGGLDVDYYQVGGHWEWNRRIARPFFSLTAGVAQWDPSAIRRSAETLPSFSLGAGSKFILADHFGLRFEARTYGTYVGGSGKLFCSQGECLSRAGDPVVWQLEALAGLVFKF